jgi:acetyltransferase-like isoleucine patch superfamily enzyme
MNKIRTVISLCVFGLLSLPKTIYFNFKSLPIHQAVFLPILVGYKVKISEVHKGIIEFDSSFPKFRPGLIRFGYGGPKGIVSNRYSEICLQNGKLMFAGRAFFGEGTSIRINGRLHIGKNFSASKNTFISCSADGSSIGDNVMCGWNVHLRDSDGHTVYFEGKPKVSKKAFDIGNHVWICAEAHILKGVCIGQESIVAYRSTVTSSFSEMGVLIGGTPAKLIQKGVTWGPYNMEAELLDSALK